MSPLIGVTVAAYEAWNIQYATLTDKAASDFHTIPGLAESWKGSNDGKTWTYKLRDGLKWSDGKPLTAEDIAWNDQHVARRGVDQPQRDDREPRRRGHGRHDARRQVQGPGSRSCRRWTSTSCRSTSGARWTRTSAASTTRPTASAPGPFVLEKFEKGQFARFKANPNYWGGKPAVDKVVLRKFNNPDAMVAALKTGELDAAQDLPGAAFDQLAEGRQHPDGRGLPGLNDRGRDQRRRRAQEASPGAARREGAPGDRPRDRQEDARRVAC